MKRIYILLGISAGLALLVLIVSATLLLTREVIQDENEIFPTPTTFPLDEEMHYSEPSVPDTNPEYIELLERQPFWNMLPHYGDTFLVEYFQSGEMVIITTIDPVSATNRAELINQYRQEARDWLTQNGAVLSELTIEYRPDIN